MALNEQIRAELKEAMINKDSVKLTTLRGLLSAFTNELVATSRTPQDTLQEEEMLTVIRKAVKQRKDAIQQFTEGGRTDLAENEQAELAILEVYLPQLMSKEEIQKLAEIKKAELAITDASQKGQLMSTLMKDLKGKADGGDVKSVVDSLF